MGRDGDTISLMTRLSTQSFSRFPRLGPEKERTFIEAVEAFQADVRDGAVEYLDESRRRAARTAELARITFIG